eukprot:6495379-Alexandrium_andersonii.AAC.1
MHLCRGPPGRFAPPRERNREDSCVPFFPFGTQQDTEMGTSGLILDAEPIGEVSTAYFRKLLASAA